MIQEAVQLAKDHWAGGLSGAAITHAAHIVGPWLKSNGGIPGAWRAYIWPNLPPIVKTNVTVIQNPTVKDSLTAQLSPSAPSETIQPK